MSNPDLRLVSTREIIEQLMRRSDASVVILYGPIAPDDGGAGQPATQVSIGGDPADKGELLKALVLLNKAAQGIHVKMAEVL